MFNQSKPLNVVILSVFFLFFSFSSIRADGENTLGHSAEEVISFEKGVYDGLSFLAVVAKKLDPNRLRIWWQYIDFSHYYDLASSISSPESLDAFCDTEEGSADERILRAVKLIKENRASLAERSKLVSSPLFFEFGFFLGMRAALHPLDFYLEDPKVRDQKKGEGGRVVAISSSPGLLNALRDHFAHLRKEWGAGLREFFGDSSYGTHDWAESIDESRVHKFGKIDRFFAVRKNGFGSGDLIPILSAELLDDQLDELTYDLTSRFWQKDPADPSRPTIPSFEAFSFPLDRYLLSATLQHWIEQVESPEQVLAEILNWSTDQGFVPRGVLRWFSSASRQTELEHFFDSLSVRSGEKRFSIGFQILKYFETHWSEDGLETHALRDNLAKGWALATLTNVTHRNAVRKLLLEMARTKDVDPEDRSLVGIILLAIRYASEQIIDGSTVGFRPHTAFPQLLRAVMAVVPPSGEMNHSTGFRALVASARVVAKAYGPKWFSGDQGFAPQFRERLRWIAVNGERWVDNDDDGSYLEDLIVWAESEDVRSAAVARLADELFLLHMERPEDEYLNHLKRLAPRTLTGQQIIALRGDDSCSRLLESSKNAESQD